MRNNRFKITIINEGYMRDQVTPEQFHSDMKGLLDDYRPDRPEDAQKLQSAFAYMAQMLAWTGYRAGAEVALKAAERNREFCN